MVSSILYNKNSTNLCTDIDAIKLAKKLDGLPLTLAIAGVYLKQASIGFLDYLRLYEKL